MSRRVEEIRERLAVGGLNKRDAADLAYLLAENERWQGAALEATAGESIADAKVAELEATVRAVEELIEPYVTRDAISGSIDETRRVHVRVADLRAALNHGGETNGD